MPGAKARSAPQSRGLASLVRVTWCFACSPQGSAGSTGRAEAVVGITCPKPAGRRYCWGLYMFRCKFCDANDITTDCISETKRPLRIRRHSPSRHPSRHKGGGGMRPPPCVWLLIRVKAPSRKPACCLSRDEAVDTRVKGPGSTSDL